MAPLQDVHATPVATADCMHQFSKQLDEWACVAQGAPQEPVYMREHYTGLLAAAYGTPPGVQPKDARAAWKIAQQSDESAVVSMAEAQLLLFLR